MAAAAIIAAVGAVGAVASAVVSAAAASRQAKARASAARYRKEVLIRNQGILAIQGQHKVIAAQQKAASRRRLNRRKLSQIRNNYGGFGIDLAGSPLDVLEDSALELETDAAKDLHAGKVAKFDTAVNILKLEDQIGIEEFNAENADRQAGFAKTVGILSAVTGIAVGAGKAIGAQQDHDIAQKKLNSGNSGNSGKSGP